VMRWEIGYDFVAGDDAGFAFLAGRAAQQAANVGECHGAGFATDNRPIGA
jgi:hypothetical protein